jgi:transcriptional regulator with XRE-family HTH domain
MGVASDVDVHVGLRMRQRREALGISQGRLGRHLGLKFSQIQKYEKGANRIGAGRLYEIADFLGVSTSWFYEGFDRPGAVATPAYRAGLAEEARALTVAFEAIDDPHTRASVLALVRSLASSGPETGDPALRAEAEAPT